MPDCEPLEPNPNPDSKPDPNPNPDPNPDPSPNDNPNPNPNPNLNPNPNPNPNSTTFMLPAETFPPHIRSTLSGFSAACGKLGATIGSAAFKPLSEHAGLPATMLCCAAVSLLGLGLTYCFVEDKRGARMEGEEDRSSVFCAHEGEGEPPPQQQQPAAQYGARGAVAVVGLH